MTWTTDDMGGGTTAAVLSLPMTTTAPLEHDTHSDAMASGGGVAVNGDNPFIS